MFRELKTAKDYMRKKGMLFVIRGGFRHYIASIFFSPVCYFRIKSLDRNLGLNSLVDFAFNTCNKMLAPLQVKSEILQLLGLLKSMQPKTVLEIGTAQGGTLFLLTRAISRNASIVSLDLPGGRFGGGYVRWKKPLYKAFALPDQKIQLIRENSHKTSTFNEIKKMLGNEKVDFLFIDGDHTYDGVKMDFEMYKPLVKTGGIIALHDIVVHPPGDGCEVSKFWNEIKKRYHYREFVENWHQKWGGIGVIWI